MPLNHSMLVEAIKPSVDIHEVVRRFIHFVLQLLQLSVLESRRLAKQSSSYVSWTKQNRMETGKLER